MPAAVLQGMIRQGVVSADVPAAFQKNAVWRCMDGKPAVVKQVFTSDARGFIADVWFKLTP